MSYEMNRMQIKSYQLGTYEANKIYWYISGA